MIVVFITLLNIISLINSVYVNDEVNTKAITIGYNDIGMTSISDALSNLNQVCDSTVT